LWIERQLEVHWSSADARRSRLATVDLAESSKNALRIFAADGT
jgi:hypothetical protein